jgi:hypothetical protein
MHTERPVPAAGVFEPAHVFGGYDGWAALHREAADAAERWLAAILGERPTFAVAAAPAPLADDRSVSHQNAENRRIERLRHAAVKALHAPAPVPRRPAAIDAPAPPRTAAGRNAESRAVERLREAAVRDLDGQRRDAAGAAALPVRSKSLPTRRRSEPPTSGDMNAVMVSIPRTSDPYVEQISERPDAATWAHTAASVARND